MINSDFKQFIELLNKNYESRVNIEIQGSEIDFIDLESFKKNKKAVGRHQDLADLENLE